MDGICDDIDDCVHAMRRVQRFRRGYNMDGICDDVDDCVGSLMHAAFATALVLFTNAVVRTS